LADDRAQAAGQKFPKGKIDMAECTIRFHDGHSIPWATYRELMNGHLSPQAAVARL
jgi:hypothetical protein